MTLFAGWSVRRRMSVLVAVTAASLVTLAVTSLMGVGALSGASTNLGTAKDAVADILPPPLNLMGAYLLTHELEGASDAQQRSAGVASLTAALRSYEERSAVWRRTFAHRPELIATLDAHDRTARAFIARCEKDFIPAVRAGDETRARRVRETELLPLFRANETTAARFTEQSTALQTAATRHFDDVALRARVVSTAVALVALLLTLILVGTVSRMLVARLETTKGAMLRVAEGDLTTGLDASGRDEFAAMAQAMNQLVASMRKALEGVSRASGTVARASRELAESVTTLSHGSRAQAASLEEAAASLEQITATMKHNADGAQQASVVANDSRRIAEEGGQVTGAAVQAMSEINARSREIAAIITTIDEIAFQTNLLALNAAVEAARAGEQGRGFAVVASEVRNLAQRSAKAAAEIKALIQHSVRQIDDGTKLVNRSGETLGGIVSSVTRLSEIVAEIAAANREQSSGIQQVNDAVGQMDRETQNSAARTEELSATAESLAYESRELQGMVAHFRLGEPAASMPVPDKVVPAKIVTGDFGRPKVSYSVPVAVARANGRAEPPDAGFEEL